VINYSGRASELGSIINLVDRRRQPGGGKSYQINVNLIKLLINFIKKLI